MKRSLAGAAVLAAALAVNGTAAAGGPGGHPSSGTGGGHPSSGMSGGTKSYNGGQGGSSVKGSNYQTPHGRSFSGGTYYAGKDHHHWTYQCYSQKYGCNCYWCPYTTCYYYWCEPSCCYYPVSYIASAPPCYTPAPVQVQVQTQTQTQTQVSAQGVGRPAGVPPLPQ